MVLYYGGSINTEFLRKQEDFNFLIHNNYIAYVWWLSRVTLNTIPPPEAIFLFNIKVYFLKLYVLNIFKIPWNNPGKFQGTSISMNCKISVLRQKEFVKFLLYAMSLIFQMRPLGPWQNASNHKTTKLNECHQIPIEKTASLVLYSKPLVDRHSSENGKFD